MSTAHVMISTYPLRPSIEAQDPSHNTFCYDGRNLNAGLDQNSIQVLATPNDPPTRQDWEAYRAIFTQLYRAENRSLKDVVSFMADQYSFKAT